MEDAVTRWDVDVVLGEFIGELNASHTYHGGGDSEEVPQRSVGLLSVDWELANGAYRVKEIVRGGPWDAAVRSPLDEPGVNVKAGEYVLAVNGVAIDTKADPWAAFQGLGGKTVLLTVNARLRKAGACPYHPWRTAYQRATLSPAPTPSRERIPGVKYG